MSYNSQLFESLIDRADAAVSSSGGRNGVLNWIEKNTRRPDDKNKPFSTFEHEFQNDIINEQANSLVVQKPAQRGVSEIFARIILALAAKYSGKHFMYVLPSAKFASKFAATRIDPIIDASPRLKELVSKAINNSEVKQIGSSFIWIGGAQSDTQAISVPALGLFIDEQSFCDPAILSTYKSRLGHQRSNEKILVEYSTPLFPGFGISESHEQGSQHVYMTFHTACSQWVVINSLEDIVLPGFDDRLENLTYEDLKSGSVVVPDSWVKCPHCGRPVTRENMADPRFRTWVPRYPDRAVRSYQVDALDMAARKFASDVISDLEIYKRTDVWIQFGLGYPHSNSDSTIMPSALESAFTAQRVPPEVSTVYGAVSGMDIGNLSYLTHARKVGRNLEFFNMETTRQDGDNLMGVTFVKRFLGYRCQQGVIDKGPDLSVCKYAQSRVPYNRCWAGGFVRGHGKASLNIFEKDENEGVVKIWRTAAINEFVLDFNAGRIKLPAGLPFEAEVKEHLGKVKRVTKPDALGEEASVWVSAKPDHWFFACFYAWLASRMSESDTVHIPLQPTDLARKVRIGSAVRRGT